MAWGGSGNPDHSRNRVNADSPASLTAETSFAARTLKSIATCCPCWTQSASSPAERLRDGAASACILWGTGGGRARRTFKRAGPQPRSVDIILRRHLNLTIRPEAPGQIRSDQDYERAMVRIAEIADGAGERPYSGELSDLLARAEGWGERSGGRTAKSRESSSP